MPAEMAVDTPPDNPSTAGVASRGDRGAAVVLGAGLAVLAGVVLIESRGFGFVVDEWDVLAHHVHGDLLTPYNGHLSLLPIGLYQVIVHTIGPGSYLPFTLIGLAVFLAIPVAMFRTHRVRVDPWLVTFAALGVAWSWAAAMNAMYGFLINFNLPILALVVAWSRIRRDTFRDDMWAMGALAVALASSSVGVVVAFAIGIELLVRRVPLRRLARFSPPVFAWLVWWVFGHDATAAATVGERADYAWNLGVGILAGFTLGWKPGAAPVAMVLVAVLVVAHRRWKTIDAHVVAIGVTLVFFIALSAWSRAGDLALNPPDATRYVWVGDILIIAALLWCARDRRIPRKTIGAAALVVLVGAAGLVGNIADHRTYVLRYTDGIRPFLVGAEIAGDAADPARILPLNMIPVTVGEYLDLVDAVGSPVAGVAFDALGSEAARAEADRLLVADGDVVVMVGTDPGACASAWQTRSYGPTGELDLEPGSTATFVTAAPTTLGLRRLATKAPVAPDTEIPAGRTVTIRTRPGSRAWPWTVSSDVASETIRICVPPSTADP